MRWFLAVVAICSLPAISGAETRFRLGGVAVTGAYMRYGGYGFWSPYFYDPFYPAYFYHPYYRTGFAQGPNMGQVRLRTATRDAEVFLDGAYAGVARDLKSIWLEPGAYNLELRAGSEAYARRIYVLSGKTIRLDARLEAKP